LAKYAIKIQKVFRGYQTRKRRKQFFKNIKYEDDEEFDEVDISFKEPNYDDFTLKIPDNFTLKQFAPQAMPQGIPKREVTFTPNSKSTGTVLKPITSEMKNTQDQSYQEEEDEKQDDDISVVSANTSKSVTRIRIKSNNPVPKPPLGPSKEEKEKIKNDWGLTDENARRALEYKITQNYQRKQKKKELTPDERLEKFRQMAKKR